MWLSRILDDHYTALFTNLETGASAHLLILDHFNHVALVFYCNIVSSSALYCPDSITGGQARYCGSFSALRTFKPSLLPLCTPLDHGCIHSAWSKVAIKVCEIGILVFIRAEG